ncbi:hypothetical protein Adt_35071 [Abeliophyllum distichum]|uniref:Uncharacterized protein n=1 Tax=Abeliophyllum distichum TaxID=126358 RepID=A0ABD1QDP4_9LAMI
MQALEGLQTALDSGRIAYEQMEADLKESDSNVLNLTKQLDNANAAQKVAAEALEAANQENRCLLDEVQNLKGDLESSENGRKEAESEVARLMGEKKEMEENWGRVGQQEVPIVLRKDHPSFDVGPLEARFPPPDAESEEYS